MSVEETKYLFTVANDWAYFFRHMCKSNDVRQLVDSKSIDELIEIVSKSIAGCGKDSNLYLAYAALFAVGIKDPRALKNVKTIDGIDRLRWANEILHRFEATRISTTRDVLVSSKFGQHSSSTTTRLILPK